MEEYVISAVFWRINIYHLVFTMGTEILTHIVLIFLVLSTSFNDFSRGWCSLHQLAQFKGGPFFGVVNVVKIGDKPWEWDLGVPNFQRNQLLVTGGMRTASV
jgi:hypothetical protein